MWYDLCHSIKKFFPSNQHWKHVSIVKMLAYFHFFHLITMNPFLGTFSPCIPLEQNYFTSFSCCSSITCSILQMNLLWSPSLSLAGHSIFFPYKSWVVLLVEGCHSTTKTFFLRNYYQKHICEACFTKALTTKEIFFKKYFH